jgi:hypothetical protein
MLESGAADLLTLMHMLGHSRLDMVLKYAHPSDRHKRDAVRKFEDYRKKNQQSERAEHEETT